MACAGVKDDLVDVAVEGLIGEVDELGDAVVVVEDLVVGLAELLLDL